MGNNQGKFKENLTSTLISKDSPTVLGGMMTHQWQVYKQV